MASNLFPLRSSAGWFASPATVEALQQHIKLALLCYDDLYFQDGSYSLEVTEKGAMEIPFTDKKERKLRFFQGGTVSLSIAKQSVGPYTSILEGPTLSSYHVDFQPVLQEAGLLSIDGVELWNYGLTDQAVQGLQPRIEQDQQDIQLMNTLPAPRYERAYILKALHMDALLAATMRMNMVLDYRTTQAVQVQQQHRANRLFRARIDFCV